MLWDIRPRHGSLWLWLGLLLCAGAGGAFINQGLYRLQGVVEQRMMDLIAGDNDEDPTRTSTELGHIGQLKLSSAVVLRVKTNQPLPQPLLLKTASYNIYAAPSWLAAGNQTFQALPRQNTAGFVWRLPSANSTLLPLSAPLSAPPSEPSVKIEITATALHMNSVLALPVGARELESPQFIRVERNPLGTVQARLEKGFYLYRVNARNTPQADLPTAHDLTLPRGERALLKSIVQRLTPPGQASAQSSAQSSVQATTQTLAQLKAYFATDYRYSTARDGNAPGKSALADFLTRDRRGHCEHFATASVLLLRAAGIPARYVVGYSVQEPNRFSSGYLVRQRHAHAWTEAYVDGAWQTLDTTPPVWGQLEQSRAAFWEPVADAINWLFFQVQQWQISRTEALLTGMALLAIILLRPYWKEWRDWRAGRKPKKPGAKSMRKKANAAEQTQAEPQEPTFYQIETLLAARGMKRPTHESLHHWQARIAPQLGQEAGAALAQIIHLHYRCRFGPLPVPQDERLRLQAAGQDWIARFG
jgi:transglutaminase-like putative cysteine protease